MYDEYDYIRYEVPPENRRSRWYRRIMEALDQPPPPQQGGRQPQDGGALRLALALGKAFLGG